MNFTIELNGIAELIVRFHALPGMVFAAVASKVEAYTLLLEERIKAGVTSGDPLRVKTGRLLASIGHEFTSTGTTAIGVVYSRDVPYNRIQEFGGRTGPHPIVAKNARALAFMAPAMLPLKGGALTQAMAFRQSVMHPGAQMPERSFMRRPLAQMRTEIGAGIKQAALDGMRQAGFQVP